MPGGITILTFSFPPAPSVRSGVSAIAVGGLLLASLSCGRPAPETVSVAGRDATNPSAVGISVVSEDTVVQPSLINPSTTAPVTSPEMPGDVYVVESGDTLSVIADRFGVTVAGLSAANNISNPDAISPGQELIIPASTP